MRRPVVRITVRDESLTEIHRSVAYAWNSASRGAEAAIRAIARAEGQMYCRVKGSGNGTIGQCWEWRWTGEKTGRELTTRIEVMP